MAKASHAAKHIHQETPSTARLDCHNQIGETKKVFISYRWIDVNIVDVIDAICRYQGIQVLRDKREMSFLESIASFMDAAGKSRYFVAIMSPEYFYSRSCMYEFHQLVRSEAAVRTIPIILRNAASLENENAYCCHWQVRHSELVRSLDGISYRYWSYLEQEIDLLKEIPQTIQSFLSEVRNRKLPNGEWWLRNDCRYLVGAIKTTYAPENDEATNWTYSNKLLPSNVLDDRPTGPRWKLEPFFLHSYSPEESRTVLRLMTAPTLVLGQYYDNANVEPAAGLHVLLLNESFLRFC